MLSSFYTPITWGVHGARAGSWAGVGFLFTLIRDNWSIRRHHGRWRWKHRWLQNRWDKGQSPMPSRPQLLASRGPSRHAEHCCALRTARDDGGPMATDDFGKKNSVINIYIFIQQWCISTAQGSFLIMLKYVTCNSIHINTRYIGVFIPMREKIIRSLKAGRGRIRTQNP